MHGIPKNSVACYTDMESASPLVSNHISHTITELTQQPLLCLLYVKHRFNGGSVFDCE